MQKHKLKFIRGDDVTIGVRLENYSLDGVERVDLHAKARGKIVLRLSTTDDSIELTGGKILLNFSSEKTRKANWTEALYDLQIIKNGKIKTVLYGEIELMHDVTELQ